MPFALYGLDDGCCIVLRLEFALEVNIQRTAVLDVRHGIALVVVVSADIYHQSLTVLAATASRTMLLWASKAFSAASCSQL